MDGQNYDENYLFIFFRYSIYIKVIPILKCIFFDQLVFIF